MATPISDDGVPVNLENGGGGRCSEVPGGQNADKVTAKAKKKSKEQGCSSNSHAVLGLVILVLYYVFFVYYNMVNFSEKWWHAALSIAVESASLVLSLYLVARLQIATTPGEQNAVKPQDSDLGRILLASEGLQDNASVRGTV